MRTKFGQLLPGQVFSWQAQQFSKIFSINGANAIQVGDVTVGISPAGRFEDDIEVEADDDQLKQNDNLELVLIPLREFQKLYP